MASDTMTLPDLALPDTDGITRHLSEFTSSGPAVLVYARGANCPFCLRQLSDYAEHYGSFKSAGLEVFALSPESHRKSRRLRTGLKLPFTVLSDTRFDVAKNLGLMDHERPGLPTPATVMLDPGHRVLLSTLNDGTKSLLARDMLEYGRAVKQETSGASLPPPPQVHEHRPGPLFLRAIFNIATGLING
ncbi:MAG TPA: peroxiredoxin family protein [Candidatus Binataceae bacterium]|nr:peroxiredoxin family protein [Candidatus Binataceae bacterium]